MSILATDTVGTVGSVFQNGVRLESFHSVQLNISSTDIIKSDWDFKQFIRKLDPLCSTPLFESVRKNNGKEYLFSLVYESISSVSKLREKINLLRNEAMVLGQLLYLNIKTDKELGSDDLQKVQQSIWFRNLPNRWFDLDDYQETEISKTHMLWVYLEEQFGDVRYMETNSQNNEKSSLQMDVCVQFLSLSSSEKAVQLFGGGKCVCRRDGSSAIFHLSVEFDTTGYLTEYQRAERTTFREKLHAARKLESICLLESSIVLEKAEKLVQRDDIVALTQSASVKEGVSKLEASCLNGRFLIKQGVSPMSSVKSAEVMNIKQYCTNLKVACNLVSDNVLRLKKILVKEEIFQQEAEKKKAEKIALMELMELQTKAKNILLDASDTLKLGKQSCDQNNWMDVKEKMFNRADGLFLTLSQLVKKVSGGTRYTGVLRRSVSLLEASMSELFPVVELLSAASELVIFLLDTEKDILVLPTSSFGSTSASPGTCDAQDAMGRLIASSRIQLESFLTHISSSDPDIGRANIREVEGGDNSKPTSLTMTIETVFTEDDILNISQSIDVLMKLARELNDTEMIAHSVRNYICHDSTGVVIDPISIDMAIDKQFELHQLKLNNEMKHLHETFISDTIDSFDYRISRISALLRSESEILKEPSFLRGLKNSVEICCALLHRGVEEYEKKKRNLERAERERVDQLGIDRLAEIERIRCEKEAKRKLLETKIALLKSRKEELEAAERDEAERKQRASSILSDNVTCMDSDYEQEETELVKNKKRKGNRNDGRDTDENYDHDYQRINHKSYNMRENDDNGHEIGAYQHTNSNSMDGSQRYTRTRRSRSRSAFCLSGGQGREDFLTRKEYEIGGFMCTLQRPTWDKHEQSVQLHHNDNIIDGNVVSSNTLCDKNEFDSSIDSSGDKFKRSVESGRSRLSSVVGYKAAPMNSQALLSAMRRGGMDIKGSHKNKNNNKTESVILIDKADLIAESEHSDSKIFTQVSADGDGHQELINDTSIQESLMREALLASKLKKIMPFLKGK